jgi:hypothetical protein
MWKKLSGMKYVFKESGILETVPAPHFWGI